MRDIELTLEILTQIHDADINAETVFFTCGKKFLACSRQLKK